MTTTQTPLIKDEEEKFDPDTSHWIHEEITIRLDKEELNKLPDWKVQRLIDKLIENGCGRNERGLEDDEDYYNFIPPDYCYKQVLSFLSQIRIYDVVEDDYEE